MNAALNKILNNCNIYFNDALISKETILRALVLREPSDQY